MLLVIKIFIVVIFTLAVSIYMIVGVLDAYYDKDVLKYNPGRVAGGILLFLVVVYIDTLLLSHTQC